MHSTYRQRKVRWGFERYLILRRDRRDDAFNQTWLSCVSPRPLFFFWRSFRHDPGPIYVHVSLPASARMHVGWAWAMSRDAGEWSPPKPMSCDAREWSPPKPRSCDAGNKWNPQKAMSRIETPVTGAVLVFTKPIGSWVGVIAFR